MTKVSSTTMRATPSNDDSEESQLKRKTDALFKVGDYQRALKLIDSFILKYPEKPIGRAISVRALAADGQIDKALKELYRFYKLSEVRSKKLSIELLQSVIYHDDDEVRRGTKETLEKFMDIMDNNPYPYDYDIDRPYHVDVALQFDDARRLVEAESGDERGVSTLANFLKVGDVSVKLRVAGRLAELKDERGVPALADLLEVHDVDIQLRAAETLGKLEDKRGICHLINLLNYYGNRGNVDGDEVEVKCRAIEALIRLGKRADLINFLDHQQNWVRQRSAARKLTTKAEIEYIKNEWVAQCLNIVWALMKLNQ